MKLLNDVEDTRLFLEVFDNLSGRYDGLELRGTLVYYNGVCKFNIEGYNLCYNLLRLTKAIEAAGELR